MSADDDSEWHHGDPENENQRLYRAAAVLDDKGGEVDLAGYRLVSENGSPGLWLVYQQANEDAELVDALNAPEFKSARQVLQYLHQLEDGHATTEGDLPAPEVA